MNDAIELLNMAMEVCVEPCKLYEFPCPICGNGTARAMKTTSGLVCARCGGCGAEVRA